MGKFIALYTVFKRRGTTRHLSSSLLKRVTKLVGILIVLILINASAMVYFEKMHVGDALWLSSTTVTTVGYGDYSPATLPGRLITIITMYMFAITVLSLLVAETVDWRVFITEKKRKGLWEWKKMSDHIQIINTPNEDTDRYLLRLVQQIQLTPEFRDLPIQILTRKYPDGLPDAIARLKVLHRTGAAENGDVLRHINLDTAKYIIILARDTADGKSDSLTFDILCRVKEIAKNASVIAEAVSDENKQRFLKYGADVVLRPVRAYPEMIARFMAHPGTELVLENLFEYSEDFLCRIDYQFENLSWKEIVSNCVAGGVGTPLAYMGDEGVQTNPDPNSVCSGSAIIAMVNERQQVDANLLKKCLVQG